MAVLRNFFSGYLRDSLRDIFHGPEGHQSSQQGSKGEGEDAASYDKVVNLIALYTVSTSVTCRVDDMKGMGKVFEKIFMRIEQDMAVSFKLYSDLMIKLHNRGLTVEEEKAMARMKKHLTVSLLHFSTHKDHLEKFGDEFKKVCMNGMSGLELEELEEEK